MPIEVDSEIRVFDRDEFHALAHRVLRIAFDVHNEFERLLDESIYKRAIALRCGRDIAGAPGSADHSSLRGI